MRKEVDFSIVVPARNAEKTIGKCIESVLRQNYPKGRFEVIVIDNNSTDRTAKEIKQFPVKYLLHKKPGSGASRNLGIKNSKGEIIAFIDSGGIADKNWLLEAKKFFERNKEVNIAGGKMEPCENTLFEKTVCSLRRNQQFYVKSGFASTANMFIKRSKFNQLGGFDERVVLGSVDCEFGEKATARGEKIAYLENTVVRYKSRRLLGFLKREFRRGKSHAQLDLLRKKGVNYKFKRPHKSVGSVRSIFRSRKHRLLEKNILIGIGGLGKIFWLIGLFWEKILLLSLKKRRQKLVYKPD